MMHLKQSWVGVAAAVFAGRCWLSGASDGNPYPEVPRDRCFDESQGTIDRSDITVRVALRGWLSAELTSNVFYIVLNEVMNYNVLLLDTTGVSTKTWGVDLEADLFDFEMESWQAGTSTNQYLEYVIQKQSVIAGKIGFGGRSGLFSTPKALQTERFADFYLFYKDSSLLKSTGYCMFGEAACSDVIKAALGKDYPVCSKDDTFHYCGEAGTDLENYWVPAQCADNPSDCALAVMNWPTYDKGYFEQLTRNWKLNLIHTWASGKAPDVIDTLISNGKEAVFHWWVPDPFPARVNAKRISFPDYTFGCDNGDTADPNGPITCDYPPIDLTKLVRTQLRTTAPEAFFLWNRFEIYISEIDGMIAQSTAAGGTLSTFESACKFLKDNPDFIDRVAPPCISRPNPIPENGELVFDKYSMSCKVAARFPEVEWTDTCFDPRPGAVDRTDQVLRVAKRGWLSAMLTNYVTIIILKEFLGYKVLLSDATKSSTSDWGPDLAAGGFDVDMENWQSPLTGAPYREYVIEKGVVLNPGPIGYTGRSGLFVPPQAIEENVFASYYRFYDDAAAVASSNFVKYPGAPEIPDLKSALGDKFPQCTVSWCPDSTTQFQGYWVPPQCEDDPTKCLFVIHATAGWDTGYFEQLIRNLGMYVIFAYYGGGFGQYIIDYYQSDATKNLMFYMYEPDALVTAVKGERLSFPDYAYACDAGDNKDANTGPVVCDYGESDLQKLVRKEVKDGMPQAYMFLKNFQLFKDDIDGMLSMSAVAGGPFETEFEVGCWWAKQNEEKIRSLFAPPCISSPKPVSELKNNDRVFDPSTFSCPAVSCKNDEVLQVEGTVSCRRCGPGQLPNANGTDCETCKTAGYVPDRESGDCVPCPYGSSCSFGSELPDPCAKGTYSDEQASLECKLCQKGMYQPTEGQAACQSCPSPMTTGMLGSRLTTDCVCPKGMYKPLNVTNDEGHPWNNETELCLQCPNGMSCEEGSDQSYMPCDGDVMIPKHERTELQKSGLYPIPPPKFYSSCDESLGLSCFKCLTDKACPGEDVGECAGGTEGIACGRCADGFYKSQGECLKCNDVEASSLIFPAFPIIIASPAVIFLYLVSRDRLYKWNTPANYLAAAFFAILIYIQTLAAISACYLQKPVSMKSSSDWTTNTLRLLSLLRPSCTTFNSFQASFIGQLLLPVYAIAVFMFVYVVSIVVGLHNSNFRMDGNIITNCYFSLFNTFFIGIAQQTFQLFQCYEHPNGEKSMRSQADVLCSSPAWNDLVAVALVAVAVFCGGFLTLNIYVVAIAPKMFSEEWFQMRWKFVFMRYRPSIWWWGLILLVKGIWLNMPTVVFTLGASQMIWLQTILVIYFVAVYALAPWRSFLVCLLDVTQHAFLIFLFGFVPHFIPEDDPNDDENIGKAYSFFSMAPIAVGAIVVLMLIQKRVHPKFNESDWLSTATKLCDTFSGVSNPKLLARILSHLPWYDIVTINNTWGILQTTYMFDMHPTSIMPKSRLLRVTGTHTRLQAETKAGDYMGNGDAPTHEESGMKDISSKDDTANEETNPDMREPEAELVGSSTEIVKEFTKDDLLDAVDFPDEKMDGFHVMSDVVSLLTPRLEPVTTARSPRGGESPPHTPRGMTTPRPPLTPNATLTPK